MQAAVAVASVIIVVGLLAACRETKGGPAPAALATTAASPSAEPVTPPSAEPSAPPSAEPSAPPSAEPAPPPAEVVDPQQLEAGAWSNARARNTVLSYQRYLESYPEGRFAARAKRRIASLRRDDTVFLAAEKKGTLQAYETFLERFTGHRRQGEARAALKEIRADLRGRDISALLAEGKIAIDAGGSGITSVTVRVKRLVKYPLRVLIPAGTLFAAGSSSVQDMLVLAAADVPLPRKNWVDITLEAACADISAAIPGERDTFTVAEASADLRRLARRLRSEDDVNVRQAAVWIVSDNANFFDLGILVYIGAGRAIGNEEAARAMQLVDDAGIDITTRTIWLDRQGIASGLPNGPLKKWLLQ